jgi:sterol 14-demethylase
VNRTLSVPELYRFVIPLFGDVMMAAHRHGQQTPPRDARAAGVSDGGLREFELWDTVEPLVMRNRRECFCWGQDPRPVPEFRPLLVDLI